MEEPGYFFHLDQDGAWFAGGIYAFPKGVLEPYRAAVDSAKSGAALESAIAHAEQAGMTMSGIGEYARVPHGFDADHAYGDLLRKKGLVAISPAIPIETVTSPALVDVCLEYAQAILPLHQWLVALRVDAAIDRPELALRGHTGAIPDGRGRSARAASWLLARDPDDPAG